jgi:hypothetical protein
MPLCILDFDPDGGIIHTLATVYRSKISWYPLDMKLGRPQRHALGKKKLLYTYRKWNQIPHYMVVRLQTIRRCRITSGHFCCLFRSLYSPGHQLLWYRCVHHYTEKYYGNHLACSHNTFPPTHLHIHCLLQAMQVLLGNTYSPNCCTYLHIDFYNFILHCI